MMFFLASASSTPAWVNRVVAGILVLSLLFSLLMLFSRSSLSPLRRSRQKKKLDPLDPLAAAASSTVAEATSAESVPPAVVRIYVSYAPQDQKAYTKLETSLGLMLRQGRLVLLHRGIGSGLTGQPQRPALDQLLAGADILVLLISESFIGCDECFAHELKLALARQASPSRTPVVPVLLRKTEQRDSPWSSFGGLPKNGVPIASWSDLDSAWLDVAQGIRELVEQTYKVRTGSAQS